MKPSTKPPSPSIRGVIRHKFLESIEIIGDCWVWVGSMADGYGTLYVGGVTYRANKLSWWIHNKWGDTGEMFVLHSCDKSACVNPAHLRLGTALDNAQDRVMRGAARSRGLKPLYVGGSVTIKITRKEIGYIRTFGHKYGHSLEAIVRRGLQCLAEQEKSKEK